jgi:hypothetical protein
MMWRPLGLVRTAGSSLTISRVAQLASGEAWPPFRGKSRLRFLVILRQVRLSLQAEAEIHRGVRDLSQRNVADPCGLRSTASAGDLSQPSSWTIVPSVPESGSERQLEELDRLIEPWLEDYERTSRAVRS